MAHHPSPLADFSTCEISDALIKLNIPHGGLLPDIHMLSPSPSSVRICSPAYTVQMVFASDKDAPKLADHFVDTATPGSAVVIDAPPDAKNAVWGGLMSAGAIARSATGVIISGRCRDLAEHRALNFPVFARAHSTSVNLPLPGPGAHSFPPVRVEPGDWMIADEDGVVCVPKHLEDQVVQLATNGREIDARCMEDIKLGKGVQASFKLHRGK
ncbi:RraA-like protein [Cyathus striatus]|nr:RraA-like protein [Cyathus striatus]